MAKKRKAGWIKLWRQSEDNEFYFAEPFDKWHAWQDLLLMAEYEGKNKGTLKTTYKALCNRWLWSSPKKVRAYLGTLKGKLMIDVKGTLGKYGGITINIKEYSRFQEQKNTQKGTLKNTQKGTLKGRQEENTSLLREEVYSNTSEKSDDGKQDEYFDPGDLIRRKEGKGE
jgi:hypothetical protein